MSYISATWKELRPQIGNLINRMDSENCHIDAKLKELHEKEEHQVDLQAQIDEAYNKGIQDLHEAFRIIAADDGMTTSDLKDTFGICSVCNIILGFTPEEIIDKVNQWKAEKDKEDQDFNIGDEIICTYDCSMDYNKTFIYLGRDEYYMKMFDLDKMRAEFTNNFVHYRKTGKHYDAIPILVGMSKP